MICKKLDDQKYHIINNNLEKAKITANTREDQNIPRNMLEDSLLDVLATIHNIISSADMITVPEMQQTNDSFYCKSGLIRDGKRGNFGN